MNCYRAKSLGYSSREKYIWVVTGTQLGVRSIILGPHHDIQIQVVTLTQPKRGFVIEPNPWAIFPEKSKFGQLY